MHQALGCLGVVTNGAVRDLDMIADGFQFLSGTVVPSHAWVHLVSHGEPVDVSGMLTHTGDLVHADRHGAVIVPHEAARDVAGGGGALHAPGGADSGCVQGAGILGRRDGAGAARGEGDSLARAEGGACPRRSAERAEYRH